MQVSQPPLTRVDWWHEWLLDPNVTDEDVEWAARRGFNDDQVEVDGWGHQDRAQNFVTLGLLWDLVEGRLARNCLARVQYFLEGKAVEDDAFATEAERDFAARDDSQRPFTQSKPRVKISTQQIWNKVPWSDAGFDMAAQRWISMPRKRKHAFGDGFNALRSDCHEEGRQLWSLASGEMTNLRKQQAQYRFTQSEGCCYFELDGESSGFMIRDEPSLVLH
ncbi:hypothetical protein E8E13_000283 [Curvularia kusanoi]|uniref:Uncharacterized protein n=1 Tax=Curvularia kusanoi TaxID=90978 RepID=A0A9P4T2J3_CURKU|nr:hypothetical protein E8E13_000283 [Curvularia kusanoi]